MKNREMGTLDILILLFFIVSITWTFKQDRTAKEDKSDASGISEENVEVTKNQKSTGFAATTNEDSEENIDYIKLSGDDHKRCNHCRKVIGMKDNFCSHCGRQNSNISA